LWILTFFSSCSRQGRKFTTETLFCFFLGCAFFDFSDKHEGGNLAGVVDI
jgi:hypothetical protein